jgi:hypothetical protein
MKALIEHNMENNNNNCRFSQNSCGGIMNSVVLTTGVKRTTLEQANYAPQMPMYLM